VVIHCVLHGFDVCLKFFIMDSLNLISYNMHGFKNGFNTVRDLLAHNVIIALQEHWLRNDNLCQLGTFHDDLFKFFYHGFA